jgi:hypothetical protein
MDIGVAIENSQGGLDTDRKDGNFYNTPPSNLFISASHSGWGPSAETRDNALQRSGVVMEHRINPQLPKRKTAGSRLSLSTADSLPCRHGDCSRSHTDCRIRGNRFLVTLPCCLTLTTANAHPETRLCNAPLRAYSGRGIDGVLESSTCHL